MMYLNPQDLSASCDEFNSTSNVEQKDGCMKWYIYEETGDKYYAILDHNTTDVQAWTSPRAKLPYEQSLVYPVAQLLSTSTVEDVNGSNWNKNLNVRLISAYEVADIVGYDEFTDVSDWIYLDSRNQTDAKSNENKSNHAWLFDNLGWSGQSCITYGCYRMTSYGSAGYWTNTLQDYSWPRVYTILDLGKLYMNDVTDTYIGIRPVIEVSKTIFE